MDLCKTCKYGHGFTVTLNRFDVPTRDCAVSYLSAPQINDAGEVCECNCYVQFTMPTDDEIGEALDSWLKTIYDYKPDENTVAPAMQHLKDVFTRWMYDTWKKNSPTIQMRHIRRCIVTYAVSVEVAVLRRQSIVLIAELK